MDIAKQFSLEGKVALVTGAAYGIGFAIAEAFAASGAKIAFNCRGEKHMEEARKAYAEKGIDAHGYFADVSKEEDVARLVEEIQWDLGPVDILVNNAGMIKRIPMCEMEAAEFREVIDIDLVAPFLVAKAVIPGMIQKGHGKIINICSMMSELGRETVSAYAAAKGGLKMLTRNICSEYGGYNIQCNGIGPGYIATPQTAPLRERSADGSRHQHPHRGDGPEEKDECVLPSAGDLHAAVVDEYEQEHQHSRDDPVVHGELDAEPFKNIRQIVGKCKRVRGTAGDQGNQIVPGRHIGHGNADGAFGVVIGAARIRQSRAHFRIHKSGQNADQQSNNRQQENSGSHDADALGTGGEQSHTDDSSGGDCDAFTHTELSV